MYSVTLNGEFIGYTEDKGQLQAKINEYMKSGDSNTIAFVEIETLPEYMLERYGFYDINTAIKQIRRNT